MTIGQTEIRIRGKSLSVPSTKIEDRTVVVCGRWLRTAAIYDEDLVEGETFTDPESFVSRLKEAGLNADIFTFSQKLPETAPRHKYPLEWDNLAVARVSPFSGWWKKHAGHRVRTNVRKAIRSGVTVRTVDLDDEFLKGVARINNETPIRQGRLFWHFKKSFDTVKRELSTYPERSIFLGAYYEENLIGFAKMTFADGVAHIVHLLSMVKHFSKRPANLLLARAVEVCEQHGMSYLTYGSYVYRDSKSSLTEFKRRNGFEQVLVPRYYIPLTPWGRIALRLGLHRGLASQIPECIIRQFLKVRSLWYEHGLKVIRGAH